MTDAEITELRFHLEELADHVKAEGLPRHIISKIDALIDMIDLVISPGGKT